MNFSQLIFKYNMIKKEIPFRSFLAEFLGSFIIVFISSFSHKAFELNKIDILGLAISNGLTYALLSYASYSTSGSHFNPVITIQYWIYKNKSFGDVISYIICQIAASFSAALLLFLIIPVEFQTYSPVSYPN